MQQGFKKFLKGLYYNKNFRVLILVFALLILLSFNLIKIFMLPKNINVIAGKEESFDFNIPAKAVILSKDKSSGEVKNINFYANEKENIQTLNLKEPFSIKAEEEGNAKISLRFMGIPVKEVNVSVLPDIKLIPGGNVIGVRINTDGIMVLGIGSVKTEGGESVEPCKDILKAGDMILKADEKEILNKEELIKAVEDNENGVIKLRIKRDFKEMDKNVTLAKGIDGKNKIGVWVRDSTQGVGTLTYYNENNNSFGALGHGITDIDTGKLMSVKDGKLMSAKVYDVRKGEAGEPGELLGEIEKDNVVGKIFSNTEYGVYGEINGENKDKLISESKKMPIALHSQVKEGKVKILSCINDKEIKAYDAEIININRYNTNSSKSMVIKICDKELLSKTNGIVQGMSGSPIIQDGKLIGAVTHVFVNEPDKGYGIFIENMLRQEIK